MARAEPSEGGGRQGDVRWAAAVAHRTTPLTMVSAAVAGDGFHSVAGSAAAALGRPVGIALPAFGAPVVWPPEAGRPEAIRALSDQAATILAGHDPVPSGTIRESVRVSIGQEVVGVVATFGSTQPHPDQRAWLEATAAAAAVAALMRSSHDEQPEATRRALLEELRTGAPADEKTVVAAARRLGCDLSAGAIAVHASGVADGSATLGPGESMLSAELPGDRVIGLIPLGTEPDVPALVRRLEAVGADVWLSSPRRQAGQFHEALREAELMAELARQPDTSLAGHQETYRLLIGVLLRDPEELEQLWADTIQPVSDYDAAHETELLPTLQAFLAHHGSTTETAESMRLHRHTVGYRLARVHEVSGLSAYASEGRERLSLGLKAHHILAADRARAER